MNTLHIGNRRIAARLLGGFILVALLPLLIIISLTYFISEQALREAITTRLRQIADSKVNAIEAYARERKNDVAILSANPVIMRSIEDLLSAVERDGFNTPGYREAEQKLSPFLRDYIERAGYDDMFLISADGSLLHSVNRPGRAGLNYYAPLQNNSQLALTFDRARTLIDTEISDFAIDPESNQPTAYIAAPVFRNGVNIGVVALQVRNATIYGSVNDTTSLGNSGETVVGTLTEQAVVIINPLRNDPDGKFARSLPRGTGQAVVLQQAAEGVRGDGVTIDYRGVETVGAWRYIPSMRWGMLVKIDTSEAYAPVIRYRQALIVLGSITLIAALAFGTLMARSIYRPLEVLRNAVRRISSGDLNQRVPEVGNNEITELSRSVNKMATDLQALYASIEAKVEARTQELQASNAQLAEARALAEEANKAKSAFLSNMSHELRTPLNAIIGYSELLIEEAVETENEAQANDLNKIHSAGRHLLALINDILDLSKIEAGKMELYLERFRLNDLLNDVTSTIKPLVEKKQNQLIVEASADPGEMYADLVKTRQILFNLLSNASKFTEKGIVTLRVTTGKQQPASYNQQTNGVQSPNTVPFISFEVTDTGIGMTTEQLGRLFQPFTQAEASTARKFGGTGLGLTISRHFSRMMGGDIVVSSSVGSGSVFTVTLPLDVEAATRPPAAQPLPVPALPLDSQQQTILVIDDDPVARDLLERYLTGQGFYVIAAPDGNEGLRLARELQPVAITLDVTMPGVDGWTVLGRLKADPQTASIPVIMLTMVEERNLGFALGAADYLTKPVAWDRLSAALKRHRSSDSQAVLIIEDDTDTRQMLIQMLEKGGWHATGVPSAESGLKFLNTEVPALILLDLTLPGMDGLTFAQTLRRNDRWRNIPVIVITAADLSAVERAELNSYVETVLEKGATSRDALLNEVRSLVGTQVGAP
jgi:signal transduction histidine kinase/DNA-binding response OmpR family regulator